MTITELQQEKDLALLKFLGIKAKDVNEVQDDEYYVKVDGEERTYRVLTDEEADKAWEDSLDNYLEDFVMSEIPEAYQMYFDKEAWKRDARTNSWRGNELNYYDGSEDEEEINGTTYYIYRTN